MVQNQDNVSEWRGISTCVLLCQSASTIKIQHTSSSCHQQVTSSGQDITGKVTSSGQDVTEKVISSGQDITEKVTSSGQDVTEKLLT